MLTLFEDLNDIKDLKINIFFSLSRIFLGINAGLDDDFEKKIHIKLSNIHLF